MTDFRCPHCGEDLRKVGFYENAIVNYTFVDGTFGVEKLESSETVGIRCGECFDDLTLEFELQLSISRKIISRKARTRYGNVIKIKEEIS